MSWESNHPPAEPEAFRWLAPQRGLIATANKPLTRSPLLPSSLSPGRGKRGRGVGVRGPFETTNPHDLPTPGTVKLRLPPRHSRGISQQIRYRTSVEKDVDRLPTHVRVLALKKIVEPGDNPFPAGCKNLKGATDRYRIKVARDWRVVYTLFNEFNLIKIEFVGHRKDAYRWF